MRCSASKPARRCSAIRSRARAGGGFVVEILIAASPEGTEAHSFPTAAGADIDLLFEMPGGRLWAVEIKRSAAPKVERGFHIACDDLGPERRIVVHAGAEAFPMPHDVEAKQLRAVAQALAAVDA